MKRIRPDSDRWAILEALVNGAHTAPELIECTGASMSTVYATLRGLTNQGWLRCTAIKGRGCRHYEVTRAGDRALEFMFKLGQSSVEDTRASSPTAARSSA